MEQTPTCSYCDAKPQKLEFFVERSIQTPILVGSQRRNRTDPMAVSKRMEDHKKECSMQAGLVLLYLFGTRFRIRFPSSTRWSDMLQASPWVSAHAIQKIIEPNHCPLITTLTSSDHTLWGGSKNGGLYRLHNPQKPHYFGMWDGLWDDRIICDGWRRRSTAHRNRRWLYSFFEENSSSLMERRVYSSIYSLYPCKEMTCGWEDFEVCTEFVAESLKLRDESIPYFRSLHSLLVKR